MRFSIGSGLLVGIMTLPGLLNAGQAVTLEGYIEATEETGVYQMRRDASDLPSHRSKP